MFHRYGDIRQTYIGKIEECSPFLFLLLPEWFKDKHKPAWNNLILNQNRLTSQFDIYKTLADVLSYPESIDGKSSNELSGRKGTSLFSKIPYSRTCAEANIPTNYCTCHEYSIIPKDGDIVKLMSRFILDRINSITKKFRDLCSELRLQETLSASVRAGQSESLNNQGPSMYIISVQLVPGQGEFEAAVWYDPRTKGTQLIGDISRINMYNNQSHCVHHRNLKYYCYCKD